MKKHKHSQKCRLLPGMLEILILKSLDRNPDPMHGWGIVLELQQLSNDVLEIEEGSLYPALQRLEIKGYVKSKWGQSDNNRRARLYRLTPAGRKEFKEEAPSFERLLEATLRLLQTAS